jgi:hypothetical protein
VTLAQALRDPGRIAQFSERDWDWLIPQARSAGLLSRLAAVARANGSIAAVPPRPRAHLDGARLVAEKHRRDVIYELDRVYEVVGRTLGTIVLLKGAAYLTAELPAAEGRVFSDIDILVPGEKLARVESLLNLAGWRIGEIEPYDDRYYRRWMHQIPPLTHGGRQSTLDVHHSIVPPTARSGAIASATIFRRAVPVPQRPGFAVLAPEDMILHSATHLFNEGEFHNGLRDLDDLNLLLRHFGARGGFWTALFDRASELGLSRPLFYAMRHASRVFATPIPREVIERSDRLRPPALATALMDGLLASVLVPNHKSCTGMGTEFSKFALYVRGHYLRMPLFQLIPHLVRKAIRPTRTKRLPEPV